MSETSNSSLADPMSAKSPYMHLVKALGMPGVSAFGLAGNSMAVYILRQREVKLKREFVEVLCSLAAFDNLLLVCAFFLLSLPEISKWYHDYLFPVTAPYLYPITNTFMTCSSYMTAAVGVNRYLDVIDYRPRIRSGYLQAFLVTVLASLVNLPRWFEFELVVKQVRSGNGSSQEVTTRLEVNATSLRLDNDYVRNYTLITSSVLVVVLPTLCMLISTLLISRQMVRATEGSATGFLSNEQESARRRRNRGITLMLLGVIILFIVCHVGEVFIAIYELMLILDGQRQNFPTWASNIVTTNHLLLVLNSSLNFVIYCRDVVFRQSFMMVYRAWALRKRIPHTTNAAVPATAMDTPQAPHRKDALLRVVNGTAGRYYRRSANSHRDRRTQSEAAVGGREKDVSGGDGRCRNDGDDEVEADLPLSMHSAAMQQLRSLNEELGISLQGDPSPEVILRDLDPQSMILCGLSSQGDPSAVMPKRILS